MYRDYGLIYPTADLMMQAEYLYLQAPAFITTLDRLVSQLSADFTRGKRSLLPRERELILQQILQQGQKDGVFKWLSLRQDQEVGMAFSLHRSLQTLAEYGIDAEELKRISAKKNSLRLYDLAHLQFAFQVYKQTHNLYENHDCYEYIFRLPEDQALPEPLRQVKGIQGFHFYFSHPLEKKFFQWLAQRIPHCAVDEAPPPAWQELVFPKKAEVVCGFDVLREIQEVLLRIKQSLLEKVPPYQWAILARNENPYFPLLREELDKAQIPYSMVLRKPLHQQPIIQAIQIFMKTAISQHRFSLTNLLRTSLINPNPDLSNQIASLWQAEGLEGDWTTWFNRLERAAQRNLRLYTDSDEDEETHSKKKYSEVFFREARAYLLFWQQLFKKFPAKATASEFGNILLQILSLCNLNEHLQESRTIDLPEQDYYLLQKHNQASWQRFKQALKQMESVASLDQEGKLWELSSYVQELNALLASVQIPIPYGQPNGVRIGTPLRMRGQKFHGIAVLGLNDGVFPAYGGSDWMLDASTLQILREAGYLIPTSEERAVQEDSYLRSSLQMAEQQWILSYSRRDLSGQILNSSPFLLLAKNAFPNQFQLVESESSGYKIPPHHTLSEASFKQTLLATQATVKQQSQEFRIDPKQLPRQIVQSPSGYNLYQTCPYAYFLTYILHLEQPQSVESDLQPLDRGTLMHRILQALVKAWKVPLYETTPPDIAACKEQIQKVLDEYWLQPELLDLSPKLWQAERNSYRQRFESWLEEELLLFQQRGGIPQQTEWKFGQDSPLILDDACYPIQGKIDRIDFSKDEAKRVYLYDYKTGGSTYYKEYQKNPLLDLQLPCYSLVWEKQQKEPLHSAAYYFPGIGEGKPELVETVHPENWAELKKGTLRLLRNIDTLISKGIFPRAPQKDDACERCEYASLCRKE